MALGTPGSAAKVRRRLDFARKPLEGESLYLDLPGYKNAKELEEDLKFLGARIETFLTKDISYVVTNRKEALSHDVRPASPYPSPSPSPGGDEGVPGRKGPTNVPLTRGQALLQKAQGRGRRGSCNMLSLAQEWGVKVLYVRDVLARVQRLMEKYRSLAENEENTACAEDNPDVKPRRLRPPFIKVEDMSRQYRPFHHEFTSLPRIYFDSDGECPFDPPCRRPSRPTCPLDVKPRTPVSAIKPQTPVGVTKPQTPVTATKPDIKRGYCECCEAYYKDGLHQHLQGDKHKAFVRDSGNFVKLDALLATLPSLDNFLKNVVVENAQKEQSPPQETPVSEVIQPVQEPADKQRSNGDASDEVSLLSSGGEGSAHGQTGQQSTYKMSKQQTKHPNNQEPKIECGGPDKLLTLKEKETQNRGNVKKEERVPVVVLSPLPNARFSVGTKQRNNSIPARPRDETYLKRTTASIEEEQKCEAPQVTGVVNGKERGCNDDASDAHSRSVVIIISSSLSSSFSIDASSSESSPSSSCSSSSTNGTSFMSTGGSSYPSVFEDSPTITSDEENGKSKAINKEQKGKPLKNQSKSEQGTGNETSYSGWRNIADVSSSSSGSEDFSSSSSDASSSSSSLGLQRQKRRGSGVLQYTSPSSDQHRNDSSPQTERSTLKHKCEDVMQCCDPLTNHTYTPKHHLPTSVRAAAWSVAQSDDLTLRLCKTGGGDGNELVSPPRPEWSVERSGKLRLKLQRSSCQVTTPKNGTPASGLKWSVHRSGDCSLTFSGSLRKQQRPGILDSPQTARSFGSRRKLKYV